MPQESFNAYRLASARGYADDNIASGRWPVEAAFERAIEDFDLSLPQGLSTPNNYIYEINDVELEETVGVMWFAVIEKNGIRSAFVYDVEVAAAHQRKGHARRAFKLLESIVQGMGMQSIGLHVFNQNAGALALYRSLEYEVTSVNMLQHLQPQ
jgi:ribosomal protein S18 acetylase RimI-like enzyme